MQHITFSLPSGRIGRSAYHVVIQQDSGHRRETRPHEVHAGRGDLAQVIPAAIAAPALDMPVPIDGLYLGGAGCHGGPGITFIPGYNAGHQVLDDCT